MVSGANRVLDAKSYGFRAAKQMQNGGLVKGIVVLGVSNIF